MTPAEARHWLNFSVFNTLGRLTPGPVRADLLPFHILRDYQAEILLEVARLMALGVRRILVVLPTGGGKTVMASAMIRSALEQKQRSQFVVHRQELIDQTSKTFTRDGLKHGFIASGSEFDYQADTIIAGVWTLVRRLHLVLPPNLAIIDEAHHATAKSWADVLDAYPDSYVVGLTATPERLDGKGLDEHFDAIVVGPSTAELIEWGYLSPFDYYAPGIPDLKGVRTTAGDFNRADLAEFMDKPKLVGDMVSHYQRLAPGEKGIIFAASIEHSKHIANAFNEVGIKAAHVDGDMDKDERKKMMLALESGELRLLSNVDLFGEGVDVPDISYVGDGQPTKSLSKFLQKCGRGLRLFEGKTRCILADHAGNAFRHGLPDDDREWSLQGREKASKSSKGDVEEFPVRQCKECFRVVPSTVKICPGCDTEFPTQQRKIEEKAGDLAKLERAKKKEEARVLREFEKEAREVAKQAEARKKEEARVRRKIEERECMSYEDYRQLAKSRGYGNSAGWAKVQWKLRNGGRIS